MLVQICYLNNLPALPTLGEHWTLFPIMNIERLLIKLVVKSTTETTRLFFITFILLVILLILGSFWPHSLLIRRGILNFPSLSCHRFLLLFIFIILLFSRWSPNCWLFSSSSTSLSSMRINICHNSFFWSCSSLFRLLDSICSINFRKCCFKLL